MHLALFAAVSAKVLMGRSPISEIGSFNGAKIEGSQGNLIGWLRPALLGLSPGPWLPGAFVSTYDNNTHLQFLQQSFDRFFV